ncbi:plasma-membrane choline transporter-domain-containing protein [Phlyctochytrium arcticum]|nr:plasma-membrane choline transporter-domain-containing protein [Phlyctochytrium arcticum]
MNGLNPLFEKLLPAQDDTSLYVDIGNRKPRDVAFTILYVLCLGIMSFAGLIYLFTTSSRGLDKIVPRPIYTTIRDSAGLLSITITVAVGIAVLWLSLLRSFVRPVVLITVAAIPITCLLGFAAILTNSVLGKVHDPSYLGPQYDGMIAVASGFLISGVASCVFLLRRRKQIEQTIHILQLSCDILRTNPGIFAVSILLTIGYVIFAATWLFLFSHLFLKGLKETDPTGVVRWHMNASTGWVAAFYVLMYFWTSAIFKNVEKTTIAGVVGEWYFQRYKCFLLQEADSTHSRDRTIKNFKSAITKSFGSIAFASLILGVIQTLQFLTRMARGRSSKRTALNSFLSSCLDCWGRLADNISSYALVYVGLSGESFCTAAYRTTRIFRRNLILGLVTSTVTRLILLMGTVTIAFLCGVVTFFFASRGLESPFAYIVGVVGTVVPYYIVQVLGHVVQNTVDATFICYLLDLDTNSCHCESAHRIFGTSIS